jgi:CheY-like chemotaxis protein
VALAEDLSDAPHGTETLLIAEDAIPVRLAARRMLERLGYTVLDAGNGRMALEVASLHDGPIHLLLTDVVMPEMSGRELSERIRAVRRDTKIVFMSGYTDDAVLRHGVLSATAAYIQKPFTSQRLALKVREVLDAS